MKMQGRQVLHLSLVLSYIIHGCDLCLQKICHLSPNSPETPMDKGFVTGDRWVTE